MWVKSQQHNQHRNKRKNDILNQSPKLTLQKQKTKDATAILKHSPSKQQSYSCTTSTYSYK